MISDPDASTPMDSIDYCEDRIVYDSPVVTLVRRMTGRAPDVWTVVAEDGEQEFDNADDAWELLCAMEGNVL